MYLLEMLKSVLSRIPKRFQSTARAVDLSDWRSLISIRGKDAKALLQGVITNDISNLQHVGELEFTNKTVFLGLQIDLSN